MAWSTQYAIIWEKIADGGDITSQALIKHTQELSRIYNILSVDLAPVYHVHSASQVDGVSDLIVADSTDNAIVRFAGTPGALQNSLMTIDDNGSPNIPAGQKYNIGGVPRMIPVAFCMSYPVTDEESMKFFVQEPCTATYIQVAMKTAPSQAITIKLYKNSAVELASFTATDSGQINDMVDADLVAGDILYVKIYGSAYGAAGVNVQVRLVR